DAYPSVRHLDHYRWAVRLQDAGRHAQCECTALGHGVASVRQQVQEHLPELLAVGMEQRHLRGELPHYYNTMIAQMVMNECQRVVYFLAHVQRRHLWLAAAAK